MYALSRFTRTPATRRMVNPWQASEDFFRPFVEAMNAPMRTNVRETEDAYLFEAELPGFAPEEIDLSVQDGLLTIAAEHKEEEEGKGLSSRSVRRSFTIDGIDEDSIAAQYKNGVLSVTLPKQKAPDAPQPRKIAIGE